MDFSVNSTHGGIGANPIARRMRNVTADSETGMPFRKGIPVSFLGGRVTSDQIGDAGRCRIERSLSTIA